MKDAARLLAYFAAVVLVGALLAPPLFWAGQWLATHHSLTFLAAFDFESFFHRALLVAGLILLWPLLCALRTRRMADLGLQRNEHWTRDLGLGFAMALIPLLCFGGILILTHFYSVRMTFTAAAVWRLLGAVLVVPLIEEALFRGLILGILLRSGRVGLSIFITSAFFSVIHFLKAPEGTSATVTWTSGFNSIAHAFGQFSEPLLVAASFTTLFSIGWILADARLRTASLWLPIGLHAGWICGNALFNRMAHRQSLALPWIGKNLLIGLVPLLVCLVTWALLAWCLRNRPRARPA